MTLARYRPHAAALLALGLPLIATNIARMAINVTDTVIVGRTGVVPLAALVLATSYHFILFMLGSGYALALMGTLAAAIAQGDHARVRRSTRMVLWLSGLHALAVMPLLWWSGPIFRALGQTPEIAQAGQDFLRIFGFSMAPMLWTMTLNNLMATLGRPQVTLLVTLVGLPLNLLLNWVFVFGHWGAPAMGIRGSGLASLIVAVLQLLALAVMAVRLPQARPYHLGRNLWRPDWPDFRIMARLGLPVGLTLVAETALFSAANMMMGWIGPVPLAAHGIALQLSALAFMIHVGLGSAATVRIGKAAGHGDMAAIRDTARTVIVISSVIAASTATLFLTLPRTLGGLYLDAAAPDTPQILALIARLMFWAALFQLADALQAIALGLLRGVQDTRAPMILAVIAYWGIGFPAAYVAAFVLGFGPQGIWFGLLAALAAAAGLLLRRFWGGGARGDWTRAARPA